jgi:hypothetical protein
VDQFIIDLTEHTTKYDDDNDNYEFKKIIIIMNFIFPSFINCFWLSCLF